MNDFEKQWAIALQKSKQKSTAQKQALPLEIQKKQTEEEMKHFKKELLEHVKNNNAEKSKEVLKKLYVARAKQLQIAIDELKEKYGIIPSYTAEKLIEKYYMDCYSITAIVTKIVKI